MVVLAWVIFLGWKELALLTLVAVLVTGLVAARRSKGPS
jgi:hypothetical protein